MGLPRRRDICLLTRLPILPEPYSEVTDADMELQVQETHVAGLKSLSGNSIDFFTQPLLNSAMSVVKVCSSPSS